MQALIVFDPELMAFHNTTTTLFLQSSLWQNKFYELSRCNNKGRATLCNRLLILNQLTFIQILS